MMGRVLERLARAAANRPAVTLGVVLALALVGGALALRLHPNTDSDTFVGRSSPTFQASLDDGRHFGGDPVVILIREPLIDLIETKDLATVSQLEACLAGQTLVADPQLEAFTPAPAGSTPYGGWNSPCGRLAKARPAQVVYGPGTFLNRAVAAVNTEIEQITRGAQHTVQTARTNAYKRALARHLSSKQATTLENAAGQVAEEQEATDLLELYLNSGISGQPKIDDPQFIREIVFDQIRGLNQPKARFAYLFPTAHSALIQVRLKASLTPAQQAQAIKWIERAVQMPMFRPAYHGTYTVSGVPVVTDALAAAITGGVGGLLAAAVFVIGVVLLLVFRNRPRLLPLGIALAAAGITFGAVSLVGGTVTMASIAVLPILIGLAVDYAVQFQARTAEVSGDVAQAAAAAAPTIGTAALATAAGFLALALSPVPMVRGFGGLLIVGIAVALACAFTAGSAAMVLSRRRASSPPRPSPRRALPELGVISASARGAGEILGEARDRLGVSPRVRRFTRAAVAGAARHPGRVLLVGLVLACAGWVADTQMSVQSDVTKLVPPSMPALQNLRTLERVTGVSGEIDVLVHSSNVATPQTISWMVRYENTLLARFGYVEAKGCAQATLCPALSLPDLFCSASPPTSGSCTGSLTTGVISNLLKAVPPYFSQAVITPDQREATLAFGIRLMPLSRQQRVIEYMRSHMHPPAGVNAQLAGLPVLAAQADASLASSGRRMLMLLAGLVAVGLVLLAVLRTVARALVPLVPIALATGWSSLILFATQIPLNPMSATLGALVIAISTEFSVLLSERFHQERSAGRSATDALARTYRFTGSAVLTSGITAIAGFGVLTLSSITMLRDFGLVTLVDLTVSLGGVLLVLPSVLALTERRGALRGVHDRAGHAAGTLPRRRRARVA